MFIDRAVLVVAHPDDEVLWFSSILQACKKVLVCFGPSDDETVDAGRIALLANYPLNKVEFLNVREPGAFRRGRWSKPIETDAGLQLRREKSSYLESMKELELTLTGRLAEEEVIFTHNPWGEYGHEEHVQVFRVLNKIRNVHSFKMHVNGYVSNRSLSLMLQSATALGPPTSYPTNLALASDLKQEYLRYRCWTWREDYAWPSHEIFYEISDYLDGNSYSSNSVTPPLNYLNQNFNRNSITQALAAKSPVAIKSILKRIASRF